MAIGNIKRWHWMVISLVLGLAMATVRLAFDDGMLQGFGESINDQRRFEEAVVGRYRGIPLFKDLRVYPIEIDEGGGKKRLKHVAAGKYFSGTPEIKDGQWQANWVPHCFIADVPYRPLSSLDKPTDPNSTVMTYLDSLKASHGVTYTYAWWQHPRFSPALWFAGSVVLIGVVWPTLLNLLLFGSIFRPREEKGLSLRNVKAPPAAAQQQGSDENAIGQMTAALEAQLHSSAGTPAQSADAPKPVPVVGNMSAEPLAPAAPVAKEQKEYGGEFYPTTAHVPTKET